jgi:preprotein translocase subunit SecE
MAVTAKNRDRGSDSTTVQRGGIGQFIREVIDELRKVVWPTWGELYRYTLVVLFTVIVLGLFIGGVDYGLSEFLKRALYASH